MNEEDLIKETQEKIEELENYSNGNLSSADFAIGKWVKLPGYDRLEEILVYELRELKDNEIIVDIWKNVYDSEEGIRKVLHARNVIFSVDILKFVEETERPDWAKD